MFLKDNWRRSRRNYSRRNYGHTIVKMEIKEEPCRIKDEDTEEQIGEEASRRNYSRRNYGHTIVKMEFEEEPCRIKDEDTEEQIGFPAACRIRAVSRSDEGPSPGPDDNAVLKCQLVCPYGGSLYHSTDKALASSYDGHRHSRASSLDGRCHSRALSQDRPRPVTVPDPSAKMAAGILTPFTKMATAIPEPSAKMATAVPAPFAKMAAAATPERSAKMATAATPEPSAKMATAAKPQSGKNHTAQVSTVGRRSFLHVTHFLSRLLMPLINQYPAARITPSVKCPWRMEEEEDVIIWVRGWYFISNIPEVTNDVLIRGRNFRANIRNLIAL
ncbi:unnamed protein product [Leuciscus chuanchicus]